MLEIAVNTLNEVVINELETVEINQTKYDDGSVGWSVNLTFPAKNDERKSDGKVVLDVNVLLGKQITNNERII